MKGTFIAEASSQIDAPISKVWKALIDPEAIKTYMFGTTIVTDWKPGSKILWKGEWKGQRYEDTGTVLQIKENEMIQYDHFSPMSGQPDIPENHHTVTIKLEEKGTGTIVKLTQDNNASEQAREHSRSNWNMMLTKLKDYLEGNN